MYVCNNLQLEVVINLFIEIIAFYSERNHLKQGTRNQHLGIYIQSLKCHVGVS